jgi:hypothetical protein
LPDSSAEQQLRAAETYVRALRSGEGSAAKRAAPYLAEGVVARLGNAELKGKDAVLDHITGNWPNTPVYQSGGWSEPVVEADKVVVRAEFPSYGAGPGTGTLTFSFDARNQIDEVEEAYVGNPRPEPTKEIPLVAKGLINNALANGTPMVVAYVSADGTPELSLRGSVQVYSPTQLSAWLRSAEGGLSKALAVNPQMTLLYRNSNSRSTLIVKGNGRIVTDEDVKNRVFELSPEVEQAHDPGRNGAALVIDVTELRGGTPRGGVLVQP